MSVYLNSTPQEDGSILAGGATLVGTAFDYNVVTYREDTLATPQWLEMTTGGQYVALFAASGTYLETGDTGFTFRWKFWARGSGVVQLRQDIDPTYTYGMPATDIGDLTVSAGGWTIYHVTTGSIPLADFLDFDAIRLGLIGTSGTVEIQTVQLECVPDGTGTTGWWVTQPSFDAGPSTTSPAKSVSALTGQEEHAPLPRQDAVDAVYVETMATNPADLTDTTDLGGVDNQGAFINGGAPSWFRTGDVIGEPGIHYAQMTMGVSKVWVNESSVLFYPDGVTEGTDFIRIPGYTVYDAYPYARSSANVNNLPESHVDWITPHIVYYTNISFSGGTDALTGTNLKVWISVVEEDPHADDEPVDWSARGTPLKTLTPASTTLQTETLDLPSSGVFAVYAFASALDEDISTKPVLPHAGSDVAVYWAGEWNLQTSDVGEINNAKPLTYMTHFNAYSVWDPNATPPGGKLKVWLPSEEWRIIGNEAGSDTERLKMRTPDNTWWKEYRTSDGAVTTHPLKIYTAGGWVVAANMTPD